MNPDLTPAQKKKLDRTKFVTPNTDMGTFAVMQDMAEALDKLAGAETVRIEGKPGEPGKTPTKEELIKLIKPLIPPPIKGEPGKTPVKGKDYKDGVDGYTPKKGVDYFDGIDGKIIIKEKEIVMQVDSATISYLEDEINKLKDRVKEVRTISEARRGGGTSAIGVAQAFKYIAHTEEPVGAIDGVNLTYTVKNTIFWVAGFTLNGEQIAQLPNFTVSGRTITFSSALPAAYSGKDWEIKYIGH